ncbi:MAG TPA: chemotaxis protein CheX [Terriglobia bacterium]|nr:chemotaxis protein CheX [Terriglobia bacterium]
MNLKDDLVRSFSHAVEELFSTMLGAKVVPGEVTVEHQAPDAHDGVISIIGLAGSWAGTGCVTCSPTVACRFCSQMLMTESTSVNEEVLDAIAELTNIVIGSVKNDLERELGPLGLSIPTVIYGRNFKTKSAAHAEWYARRFHWDDDVFEVRVCLTPSDRSATLQPHVFGSASLAD